MKLLLVCLLFVSVTCVAQKPGTVVSSCDAILQAWYGGEAIADVLFGDYNPSGKLPVTFYKSSNQLPDFEDYSMKGRTYRFMSDALFPFGYGMSYTNFAIGEASLSTTTVGKNGTVTLTIPVSNTGKRSGIEVVQVYVRKADDANGPLKTLRGFNGSTCSPAKPAQHPLHFRIMLLSSMMIIPGKWLLRPENIRYGMEAVPRIQI